MPIFRLKVYARSVASGMMSRMDTHHASLVGVIPDLVEDSWNLKCLEQLQDQESVLKDKHDELDQSLKHKVGHRSQSGVTSSPKVFVDSTAIKINFYSNANSETIVVI